MTLYKDLLLENMLGERLGEHLGKMLEGSGVEIAGKPVEKTSFKSMARL